MSPVTTTKTFALSVADVLLGGDSTIPVPPIMDSAASALSTTLSTRLPITIPHVDLSDRNLALAIIATILPPLLWNVIGPFEYYTRVVSRAFGRPIIGVYFSAVIIAALSIIRTALFVAAIREQPTLDSMDQPIVHAVGAIIFVTGLIFFVGAYCRLGITGTYLGDYFGIFREERITAFPFSVLVNPMYDGSSIFHFGEAIMYVYPSSY